MDSLVQSKWKDLITIAEEFPPISNSYSPLSYIKACQALLSQAHSYATGEQLEMAFILYYRFMKYVLSIPKHADWKYESVLHKKMYSSLHSRVISVMKESEQLKVLIKDHYKELLLYSTTSPTLGTLTKPEEPFSVAPGYSESSDTTTTTEVSPPSLASTIGGLRPVFVHSSLLLAFLRAARANTTKFIETCGIMCGKIENNKLIITTVLIPKQEGHKDSCSATDEGQNELFEFQLANNLITICWIHTHPFEPAKSTIAKGTQMTAFRTVPESPTAPGGALFLSSVDLHTHVGYQSILPEAIAIVCAPYQQNVVPASPSFSIFNLTSHGTPNGMSTIQTCTKKGFHPHNIPKDIISSKPISIYQTAQHVTLMNPPEDVPFQYYADTHHVSAEGDTDGTTPISKAAPKKIPQLVDFR